MVLVAYVMGLLSTPAAFLGAWAGQWWYRRYRRAQSVSEPIALDPWETPPPPSPQEAPSMGKVTFRSVPGRRRHLRGRR